MSKVRENDTKCCSNWYLENHLFIISKGKKVAPFWKIVWKFPKKLNMQLAYGHFPKKFPMYTDTESYEHMLIESME